MTTIHLRRIDPAHNMRRFSGPPRLEKSPCSNTWCGGFSATSAKPPWEKGRRPSKDGSRAKSKLNKVCTMRRLSLFLALLILCSGAGGVEAPRNLN
jgi:hypothetical protein